MFCPNCKNQVIDEAEFCPSCGTNLKQIEQINSQIQQPIKLNTNQIINKNYAHKNNSKKLIIIPSVIAIIAVIIIIFGTSKLMKKDTISNNNNENIEIQDSTDSNTTGTVDPNTNLTYDKDGAFLMAIEDIFTITGRGTVVTGHIERGTININDEVQIIGLDHEIITTVVTGVEMFRSQLDTATVGDNVGLLLRDVERSDIERGQVIAKPNSIKAIKKFEANIYVLTEDEGGRHTPFFNSYRPQFYFRAIDVTGDITLPGDVEMVMPGDNIKITVELNTNIAMEIGTEFTIREGGRTVGKGTVTKVY